MKKLSLPMRAGVAASTLALACMAWNSLPRAYSQGKTTSKAQTLALSSPTFVKQLNAIQNFKASLSPTQRKLPVRLLLAKQSRTRGLAALPQFGRGGRLRSLQGAQSVVLHGQMTDRIKAAIQREGTLTGFFPQYGVATAVLSTEAMEHIATATEITHININPPRIINGVPNPNSQAAQLTKARLATITNAIRKQVCSGTVVTEGDKTHEADKVRTDSKVTGAGIKIGVISDSSEQLATLRSSGELPQDVSVLAGQAGKGQSEGTAMMEIIHDLAPDAKLEFSSAGNSPEQMAANIRALKADGCKIIVDDVSWLTESVYQEDVVSAAIREVTGQGALYFTSVGNSGNREIGPTGTWDGTFTDAVNVTIPNEDGSTTTYASNDWDGKKKNLNPVAGDGLVVLSWAEAAGKAGNDYDVCVVDSTNTIVDGGFDIQDGNDQPIEITQVLAGDRLLVIHALGAKNLPMRMYCSHNQLGASVGPTGFGHNVGEFALSVGATPARVSPEGVAGPYPGPFDSKSKIETFSSTGPRTLYFTPSGDSQTRLIKKPDITAADGVACATKSTDGNDDFNPFYGTSAAAPHAAAIAALAWSADTSKSASDISKQMIAGTIDIMANGYDYASGYGIVMASKVVTTTNPTPTPEPTATPGPTGTPGPGPTPTETATPRPTSTPVPTPTPLPAGSIAFSSPTYSVKENVTTATITVVRTVVNGKGAEGAASVKYSTTTGGTATAGSDFKAVTGTLSWAAGDGKAKTFTVPITNDTLAEPTETVKLKLADLTGTGTLPASSASATLSILDDDRDTTLPQVAITTPQDGTVISSLGAISGTASDASGVASVTLVIQRLSDGLYWNGSSWGQKAVQLATTLSGNKWSRTSGNPSISELPDDSLLITAVAFDKASNKAQTTAKVFTDVVPPQVYINTPANGTRFKSVPRVLGTVSDNGTKATVVLYIKRAKDGKYYTGTGWGNATALKVQLADSGEWTYNLPTLDPGSYTLTANATDSIGNKSTDTSTFTIMGTSANAM